MQLMAQVMTANSVLAINPKQQRESCFRQIVYMYYLSVSCSCLVSWSAIAHAPIPVHYFLHFYFASAWDHISIRLFSLNNFVLMRGMQNVILSLFHWCLNIWHFPVILLCFCTWTLIYNQSLKLYVVSLCLSGGLQCISDFACFLWITILLSLVNQSYRIYSCTSRIFWTWKWAQKFDLDLYSGEHETYLPNHKKMPKFTATSQVTELSK